MTAIVNRILDSFLVEVVVPFVAFMCGFCLLIASVVVAIYLATAPASCNAMGSKMGIEVSWGFWTNCMIMVRGTWLPWSEVVPIERDGKIVFEPKPVVRLRDAR
jgi:hypothetical protein